MAPHIEDVLLYSLTQAGDRYVFGAEVPASAADSDRWDCSELVEWSCARAGVDPRVPDGAYYQWRHTKNHGLSMSVDDARRTRGALLFVGDGTGVGRDAITHVAWSLGDGTTIEARGSRWGVGTWPSVSRFDFAGLLPGVDYSPGHGQLPPPEDDMPTAEEIANAVWAKELDLSIAGRDVRAPAWGAIRFAVQDANTAAASGAKLLQRDGVDEAAIAAALAPLLVSNIEQLSDLDVQRIAEASADELGKRAIRPSG